MTSSPNASQSSYHPDTQTYMNITDWSSPEPNYTWNIYFEAAVLAVIFAIGCLGNILIMKTTIKVETRFARQVMTLFFSLAMTDMCVCLFRIGILVYILFHPTWDNGSIVCVLWFISLALVGIAIWDNFLVGIQRLFIVRAFPVFRRYCTIPLMISLIVTVVITQGLVHVCIFLGFDFQLRYDESQTVCILQNHTVFAYLFYKIVVLSTFIGLPLVAAIICHLLVVHRIVLACLKRINKREDRENFITIIKTALFRCFLLFVCFVPFLVASIMDPDHHVISGQLYRYFDYCICAHSALSPFITLQDADVGDAVPRKTRTLQNRKNSMTIFNSSIRRIGISVITSENLKTNKSTE